MALKGGAWLWGVRCKGCTMIHIFALIGSLIGSLIGILIGILIACRLCVHNGAVHNGAWTVIIYGLPIYLTLFTTLMYHDCLAP